MFKCSNRFGGSGVRVRRWRTLWFWLGLLLLLPTEMLAQIKPRIVGGQEVPRGKYPWMVSLATRSIANNYNAHFCGGALIHPQWVVTAAHCVENKRPESVEVVVGALNLQTDVGPTVRRVAVREIILHPGYDPVTSDRDLALLLLAEPVAGVVPLEIIDGAELCEPGLPATVMGWGATSGDGSDFSPVLREVSVPLVSLAVANASAAYDGSLTSNMLPAGPAQGGQDSCQGDSGGPLIVAGPGGGAPMLAGVVSFGADGLDCGAPGNYGIHTRVLTFRSWIYGLIRPVYGEWEQATGRVGERRDPDGDRLVNWEEFLGGSDPGAGVAGGGFGVVWAVAGDGGRGPEFSFRRRTALEVRTRVFYSAETLSAWRPLDVEALMIRPPVPVPGVTGLETVTLRGPRPADGAGFYRVLGDTSPVYVSGPRPIELGQSLAHTLHGLDPVLEGVRSKDYRLLDPPVGQPVVVTARSAEFDVGLQLLEAESLEVLDSSMGNTAGGTNELLAFLPTAGVRYLVRISAQSGAAAAGGFTVAYGPATGSGELRPGAVITGALAVTDDRHPGFPGQVVYKDDHVVTGATAGQVLTVSVASSSFVPALSIHDALTGVELWSGPPEPGRSRVAFYLAPGRNYFVRVSSVGPNGLGAYLLSASQAPPVLLAKPQSLAGQFLQAGDLLDETYSTAEISYYKDDFLHIAATAGPVTLRMTATEAKPFDTFLILYDAVTGEFLAENDDISEFNFDSEIRFTAVAGRRYLVRCTTALPRASGSYSLSVQ